MCLISFIKSNDDEVPAIRMTNLGALVLSFDDPRRKALVANSTPLSPVIGLDFPESENWDFPDSGED